MIVKIINVFGTNFGLNKMSIFYFDVIKENEEIKNYTHVVIVRGCFGSSCYKVKAKSKKQALDIVEKKIKNIISHNIGKVLTKKEYLLIEKKQKEIKYSNIKLPIIHFPLPSLVEK